jgi:uncharacterized membrane protein YadS
VGEQLAQYYEEKRNQTRLDAVFPFLKGVGFTFIIAIIAYGLAKLSYLSAMGPLVLAILIGMGWRAVFSVPTDYSAGMTFSSKILLRVGIVLLGMRLNFLDIYHAGKSVIIISVVHITFTLHSILACGSFAVLNMNQLFLKKSFF